MTLVLAPEEHPRPIGLGPDRATLAGIEPIGDHATPVTEALHVPLHLVRGSAALVSQTPLPIPDRERVDGRLLSLSATVLDGTR